MNEKEDYQAAREGQIGADRMSSGLSCIPHPVKGDLIMIQKLKSKLAAVDKELQEYKEALEWMVEHAVDRVTWHLIEKEGSTSFESIQAARKAMERKGE